MCRGTSHVGLVPLPLDPPSHSLYRDSGTFAEKQGQAHVHADGPFAQHCRSPLSATVTL